MDMASPVIRPRAAEGQARAFSSASSSSRRRYDARRRGAMTACSAAATTAQPGSRSWRQSAKRHAPRNGGTRDRPHRDRGAHAPQREGADSGRVDQLEARIGAHQPGRGGGVAALAGLGVDLARQQIESGDHGVQQRTLSDPRMPDEQAAASVARAAQVVDAVAGGGTERWPATPARA